MSSNRCLNARPHRAYRVAEPAAAMSGWSGLPSALLSLSGLVALWSACVALDMSHNARQQRPALQARWLLGAGLALATGICSVLVLGVAAQPLRFAIGYDPAIAVLVWLGTAVLVAASLGCADARKPNNWRALPSAAGVAVSMVIAPMGVLLSTGARPGLDWQPGHLVLALLCTGLGSTLALALAGMALPKALRLAWLPKQGIASVLLAAALVGGQDQVIRAADLSAQHLSVHAQVLPSDTLSLVCLFGSIALLSVMLFLSRRETRQRQARRRARGQPVPTSLRDALTGLPNRQMFEGTIAQAVQQADAAQGKLALLCIDLDGFKAINESVGHAAADQMLLELSDRLRSLAQPHSVSRLAGDSFLMLLGGNTDNDAAAQLASNVLSAIGEPCKAAGHEMAVTGSIGIAMYPQHGALSTLITHAEAAMRASKGVGGAAYSFFDPLMLQSQREHAELLRDLRLALSKQQFELYYQPKIHAPSGEITGAEALLRWHHPLRGMISPTVFIPIAERFGLIDALGTWVLNTACAQVRAWREEGLRMRVAINLSVHQLRDPGLPQRIDAALKRHQINPQLLTCEITESVAMEDAEHTIKLFARLAAVGVHISIDDFGTGYSSLAYLRKLPASELKIDRSFVLDLETSNDARAVVDAVIKLAQALSLKVVAEGVETEAQNQILRSLGCDELQGYLFAKPMSAKALAQWAMSDVGPRSLLFRESLFKGTVAAELGQLRLPPRAASAPITAG